MLYIIGCCTHYIISTLLPNSCFIFKNLKLLRISPIPSSLDRQ